jgi:hypothetical protein
MKKKKIIEEFPNVHPYPDREIGIEIEMEGGKLVRGPAGWETTSDGSLRGESVEWVLTRPVSEADSYILLDRLQRHLRDHDSVLTPSDRCGVHIHVNVQEMDVDEVFKFCILYLVLENLLVEWCGEDREGNLFCLRAEDADYLVKCLLSAKKKGSFRYAAQEDIRYASMNITSLAKYGSLEFRALRTPEDFNRIKTWIKFLLAIKRASTNYKSTEEIIELISMRGGRLFLRDIFGELANELSTTRLNDRIIQAARRVQDVAYAERWKPKKKQGVENLPYEYWNGLKRLHSWCRDRDYTLIKWDPQVHLAYYTRQGDPPDRAILMEFWMEREDLLENVDMDSINFDHQSDVAYVREMHTKTYAELNWAAGIPGMAEATIEWEDEDQPEEEEYFDEEDD